jgi:hypothetical protein
METFHHLTLDGWKWGPKNSIIKYKIDNNDARFKRQQLPPYYYHQLQQQEAAEAAQANKEAETIANYLKHHDLADGNYYSSDDIQAIIKRKYPLANEQVINLVIDMLQRDVEFFTSKVEGDRFDNARLLIAARRTRRKP